MSMLRYFLLVIGFCAAQSASADDRATVPDAVRELAAFAVPRDVVQPYTEQRMSGKLRSPLQLEGTIVFAGNGDLVKTVTAPFSETVTVADSLVRLQRPDQTREFSLNKNKGLYELFSGLKAMLGGSEPKLTELFDVTVQNDGDRRVFLCKPRSRALGRQVELITIVVAGDMILSVRIDQDDNRWQELRFPAEQAL